MAEIVLTDITEGILNGDGAFDKLIAANRSHLLEEFSKQRITGSDYSTVYLGSLQTVLQQAIAYILGRQQADKQAELIDAQKDKTLVEVANLIKQGQLIDQQILKMQAEIEMIHQQIAISIVQEGNLLLDRDKTAAEIALLEQNTSNAAITATNLIRQQAKIEAETELLRQKKITELGSTQSEIDGVPITGSVGKQIALLEEQRIGYIRNSEQKMAKIMSDAWAVRRGTDEAENPAGTGLTNVEIEKVMTKAISGIEA